MVNDAIWRPCSQQFDMLFLRLLGIEVEDNRERNPGQEITDDPGTSNEDGHAEATVTLMAQNENLSWSPSPPENQGRHTA